MKKTKKTRTSKSAPINGQPEWIPYKKKSECSPEAQAKAAKAIEAVWAILMNRGRIVPDRDPDLVDLDPVTPLSDITIYSGRIDSEVDPVLDSMPKHKRKPKGPTPRPKARRYTKVG